MFITENEVRHRQPDLAANLTRIRKAHHVTQQQVADILKIKRSTYAYYERDVTPSIEILDKLCILFDVTLEELVYGGPRIVVRPPGKPLGDGQNERNFGMLRDNEWQLVMLYRLLPDNAKLKVLKEAMEQKKKSEEE